MDASSGQILYEVRAHEPALIASTTKIMTALIVIQECDLQADVCISSEAVGVEGSSIYLKQNEILTVEELLYGMMLHSGNDAAAALAIYCGGNIDSFVEKMNRKAAQLQLHHTVFANPHGLDAEQNRSTAYDLAKLTAYAMNDEVFRSVVSAKHMAFETRCFTNHNKLLWRCEGAIGVKTGYTKAAGRILVSCAERNGKRLIAVTIDDPNDWKDHCELYDYGFDVFASMSLSPAETVVSVPVVSGAQDSVRAAIETACSYSVKNGERLYTLYHVPHFVYAPVLAGDKAGEMVVMIDGKEIDRVPLYWQFTVLEGA